MNLILEEQEIKDIITVLEQLPTGSNAWPLVQKIKTQVQSQIEEPTE